MGLVIQMQRRAIEDLRTAPEATPPPPIMNSSSIYDSEGRRLYPLGVSPGYGTCSDVENMDVLVLTDEPTAARRNIGAVACSYAVLVRPLSADEMACDSLSQLGVARKCVELLQPRESDNDSTLIFHRTGVTAIYTKLVSA